MRERFRHIIENLPPTGIGVHGTSLNRAEKIVREGLDPNKANASEGFGNFVFYAAQPPKCPFPRATFRHLTGRIHFSSLDKAVYHSDETAIREGDKQALVLFTPNQLPHEAIQNPGTPYTMYDPHLIPPENILGIVQLEDGKTRMDKSILRDCIRLLNEKGVIDFAKPQQPQAK